MPQIAVRRCPETDHVDVPFVDAVLRPPGEIPGTRIQCATEAERRDRAAQLTLALEAAATRVRANVAVDMRQRRRAALAARLVARGVSVVTAAVEAAVECPPRIEQRRIVEVDDLSIAQVVAAERLRTVRASGVLVRDG